MDDDNDVPCCHGARDECSICDAYAASPEPPRHGEEYGAYQRRTNHPTPTSAAGSWTSNGMGNDDGNRK